MKLIKLTVAAVALLIASPTFAQSPAGSAAKVMNSAPADSVTVTEFYKQSVYDLSNKKIGQIADVLVGKDGKINAFVIGAGGFLGIGRHDVLVPFSAVKVTKKNGKDYLVMDATKDELKNAPGFRYDRTAMTWTLDDGNRTNGRDEVNRKPRR